VSIHNTQPKNYDVLGKPPRSPETKAIELGLWMSLQSIIWSKHRDECIHNNAIAY